MRDRGVSIDSLDFEISLTRILACRRAEEADIVLRDEDKGRNREEWMRSKVRFCRLLPVASSLQENGFAKKVSFLLSILNLIFVTVLSK